MHSSPDMSSERNNSIQRIFQRFYIPSADEYQWNSSQTKAAHAIMMCRTAELGGHVDVCDNCGHVEISYNSCRNRHCPLCGGLEKEKWIARNVRSIVNTRHYHVVFTIPAILHPMAMANREVFYNAMFTASAEAVKSLCADKRILGAMPGFTSVLHTWGQQLAYHPHIHMVLSAGGFANGRWKDKVKKKIFIPVKALSSSFRGRLVSRLRKAYENGDLRFDDEKFSSMLDSVMDRDWVVYCKEPFRDNAGVYEYLGRYTHRTAISNDRIVSIEEDGVTFSYRDYADSNRRKTRKVSGKEFIRLFMLHVLKPGFMRIRHYGIYASACRNGKLLDCLCQTLTVPPKTKIDPLASTADIILQLTGRDIRRCPCCGSLLQARASPLK